VLIGIDHRIERGGVDEPFFNQQGFERLDAQRRV
jgi:hypothetical protein